MNYFNKSNRTNSAWTILFFVLNNWAVHYLGCCRKETNIIEEPFIQQRSLKYIFVGERIRKINDAFDWANLQELVHSIERLFQSVFQRIELCLHRSINFLESEACVKPKAQCPESMVRNIPSIFQVSSCERSLTDVTWHCLAGHNSLSTVFG